MAQPLSKWPDAERIALLVREAQREMPGALDRLLDTLRPALVAFFSNRLPHELAEDATQNALSRVARALRRIDPERADAYVATVARNLFRTAHRRRAIDYRRHADIDLADVLEEHRQAPDERAEYEELVRAVHGVVAAKLSPPLAEIIRGLIRGETPTEIALRQGVSAVTVRTRLMRARMILRRELRIFLDDPVARTAIQDHQDRRLSG